MRENKQFFALMSKCQHSYSTHVINLNRIKKMVVETDTCGTINDHVQFFCEGLPYFRQDSETFLDKVSLYWNYSFLYYLNQLWARFEQHLENFTLKDILLKSILQRYTLLASDEHVDLSEVRTAPYYFLKNHFGQKACAPRNQDCFVCVKLSNAKIHRFLLF